MSNIKDHNASSYEILYEIVTQALLRVIVFVNLEFPFSKIRLPQKQRFSSSHRHSPAAAA